MVTTIAFNTLGDDRGSLISLEQYQNIPFDIKRIYYIFNTKSDIPRGFHAHKKLQQIAICVKGSCRFILDDGEVREEIILASPDKGLLIDNLKWHEMHDFSDDFLLIVLANEYYDESDYIRDYQEFIKFVDKTK